MVAVPPPGSAEPGTAKAELDRLLSELDADTERADDLVAQIDATFGDDQAVVVLDMSGFSRTVRTRGIVPFLLMIHRMQNLACPAVAGHDGILVKAEADNLLCLFPRVEDAVAAAREIVHDVEQHYPPAEDGSEIAVSIGIGFGHVLNLGNEDVYGDEVNLASKLGEDIAQRGEILLTANARAQLEDTDVEPEEFVVSVSGLELTYYRL